MSAVSEPHLKANFWCMQELGTEDLPNFNWYHNKFLDNNGLLSPQCKNKFPTKGLKIVELSIEWKITATKRTRTHLSGMRAFKKDLSMKLHFKKDLGKVTNMPIQC